MPVAAAKALEPRKTPVQARSEATVAALFEASTQVLLAGGYSKFTTTRVAERAGVSVGTLYQYFPNKQALHAAVVGRHLDAMVAATTAACQQVRGQNLDAVVGGLVEAFIAAELRRIDVSLALHEPSSDVGGAALIKAGSARAAAAAAQALDSCPDVAFDDTMVPATIVVTVCSALMLGALETRSDPLDAQALRQHMNALVLGYLRAIARAKRDTRAKPHRPC